jgi:hypothetical protein
MVHLLGRRGFLAGALAALPAAARPAHAAARVLAFDVLRDGAPIGTHRVRIRTVGARTDVEIEIDLAVRVGFLTLYRYSHRARETWQDARLVALDARTDDNGTRTHVVARATDDGLAVEGPGGAFVAPADTTPTSYWRREQVAATSRLDSQSGRLIDVRTVPAGERGAPVDGAVQRVAVFRLEGDLEAEVGYAADGSWATLEFAARGSRIAYARRSSDAAILQAVD